MELIARQFLADEFEVGDALQAPSQRHADGSAVLYHEHPLALQ